MHLYDLQNRHLVVNYVKYLCTSYQRVFVVVIYQALFDRVKVSAKPFFLHKTLTYFVFYMLAIFLGLLLKDMANTFSLRPI